MWCWMHAFGARDNQTLLDTRAQGRTTAMPVASAASGARGIAFVETDEGTGA